MSAKGVAGFDSIPLPVGSVIYLASTQIPQSFFVCNGQALEADIYDELFSVIGTSYGSPSAGFFNLPNLITTSTYIQAAASTNVTPVPSSGSTSGDLTLTAANIPSLSQANFTFSSWATNFVFNGDNKIYPYNPTDSVASAGSQNDSVKHNSSTYNTWAGSVTGQIGYTNGAPTAVNYSASLLNTFLDGLTMIPVVKAWTGFYPPDYQFVQPAPQDDGYFTTFPAGQYLADPALSGFFSVDGF